MLTTISSNDATHQEHRVLISADLKDDYRPDIDGLRAVAVMSVILFHAKLGVPGGFVGVDVFFVISGYLITKIICKDLAEGHFSLGRFYERRIRRIFPALFAMLSASTITALLVLRPSALKSYGKTLVAASAFSSNILFFRHSGYFETRSELEPLLHSWTLSVEEQFYLFWPLLLAAFSIPFIVRSRMYVSSGLLVASFWISIFWVTNNPNAAFYLFPSRAWELLIGGVISIPPIPKLTTHIPRKVAAAMSFLGIAMLAVSLLGYTSVTPFPGIAAVLPAAGAALLISSGEGRPSPIARVLAARPLVLVGLASYSLYIWHWPILVFCRLLANRDLNNFESALIIPLITGVGLLSWRFIEAPFRRRSVIGGPPRNWIIAGITLSGGFALFGGFVVSRDGLPERDPSVAAWEERARTEGSQFQSSPCLARGASLPPEKGCLLGMTADPSKYEVVLWGDSHAAQLAPALAGASHNLRETTREITKAGCPPLPGVTFFPRDEMRAACEEFNASAVRTILQHKHVHTVIIAARWDALVLGRIRIGADTGYPSLEASTDLLVDVLRATILKLSEAGDRVILVGQVPLPTFDPIACVSQARFRGQSGKECARATSPEQVATERVVNETLARVIKPIRGKVSIVYPYESLCHANECPAIADGQLLYQDEAHLSSFGAQRLINTIEKAMDLHQRTTSEP